MLNCFEALSCVSVIQNLGLMKTLKSEAHSITGARLPLGLLRLTEVPVEI